MRWGRGRGVIVFFRRNRSPPEEDAPWAPRYFASSAKKAFIASQERRSAFAS